MGFLPSGICEVAWYCGLLRLWLAMTKASCQSVLAMTKDVALQGARQDDAGCNNMDCFASGSQ